MTYPDREEVLREGDVFYLPAPHTGVVEEDIVFAEFSPPSEHDKVLDVVRRNAAEAAEA